MNKAIVKSATEEEGRWVSKTKKGNRKEGENDTDNGKEKEEKRPIEEYRKKNDVREAGFSGQRITGVVGNQ